MNTITKLLGTTAVAGIAVLGPHAAQADEPTSSGVPVSDFATQYHGCAGPLRSMIASGALDGVQVGNLTVPDGFSKSFNPGAHVGSTDEIAFLMEATGLDQATIQQLCAALDPR
jgi:hypothetical protein